MDFQLPCTFSKCFDCIFVLFDIFGSKVKRIYSFHFSIYVALLNSKILNCTRIMSTIWIIIAIKIAEFSELLLITPISESVWLWHDPMWLYKVFSTMHFNGKLKKKLIILDTVRWIRLLKFLFSFKTIDRIPQFISMTENICDNLKFFYFGQHIPR